MEPRTPKDNRPRPPGNTPNGSDPSFNWKGIILFAIAFMLIAGAFLAYGSGTPPMREINYSRLLQLLKDNQIDKGKELELVVQEGRNTQQLTGYFFRSKPPTNAEGLPDYTNSGPSEKFQLTVFMNFNRNLEETLEKYGVVANVKSDPNMFASLLVTLLPFMILLLLIYFFFRQQIRMAGKGALNFGKSRARMMSRDKNKITFKDVAGVDEAKEEVQELVEFLKDPKKFQKLGGRIPKGVLLVGPPGTGKTLLARAIAGEADVPFFSISGSDFVEMFVGVGASRVRDMFEQGKKAAPCLIFIDEIDAVGRHRGHGVGGGHDEREQTLNALLVEMDGFDTQEGVIIIAATNRPDVLDPALLRPGRFDRQVTVNLPDVKGREQILSVHAKKVKVADGVDLAVLARGTPGYSGAELANVINEAALVAARKGLKAITIVELEDARDKVRWGKERRSLAMSEKEKISTAWHEAGHALVSVLLEHTDPLHKVTIIPRGRALGVTMSLPEGDQYSFARKEALDVMAMTAAGRIAEELFTEDISTGASNDIKQMTRLARKMVCEWGMSEQLGMIEYGEHEDYVFLGRDISRNRDYSEATAQAIDREVKALIDQAYNRAKELVVKNRDKLKVIADGLLEFETLDGEQIRDIIATGGMSNPPASKQSNTPPPMPPQTEEEDSAASPNLPSGGLTEAPAGA